MSHHGWPSSTANASTISLGAAFNTAGAQDRVFSYAVVPQMPLSSDFDGDGDAGSGDWQVADPVLKDPATMYPTTKKKP